MRSIDRNPRACRHHREAVTATVLLFALVLLHEPEMSDAADHAAAPPSMEVSAVALGRLAYLLWYYLAELASGTSPSVASRLFLHGADKFEGELQVSK